MIILVVVVVGVGAWWLFRTPLPTRAEAEERVAARVGTAAGSTVTAVCEEPRRSGFRCLLRDDEGRYGYALIGYDERPDGEIDGGTDEVETTTWDFPIDSDGRLVEEFDADSQRDVDLKVFGLLRLAAGAVSPDPATHSGSGDASCPLPQVGATAECAGEGLVSGATLRRTTDTHYELRASFTLPTT